MAKKGVAQEETTDISKKAACIKIRSLELGTGLNCGPEKECLVRQH